MADVRLLFPSLYLSAADLRGKDVNLTIGRLVVEDLRTERGSERKPVLFFREIEERNKAGQGENKRLVLNKTNMKTIGKLYGFEANDWPGKRITLYATTCQSFGQIVDCIRVREVAPPARQQARNGTRKPAPEAEPDLSPRDSGELTEEEERRFLG
jgi:hypothetical protein